jgi:hypothetical protein
MLVNGKRERQSWREIVLLQCLSIHRLWQHRKLRLPSLRPSGRRMFSVPQKPVPAS